MYKQVVQRVALVAVLEVLLLKYTRSTGRICVCSSVALSLAGAALGGQSSNLVGLGLPKLEALSRSAMVGHANASQPVHLTVCLQGNIDGLQKYVDDISNPVSPNYRNYLTPSDIGARFGQSSANVQGVVNYLKSQGFTIRLVGQDNLHILADGTVGQAEVAFGTTINKYHSLSATENGHVDYISNATDIKVPSQFAGVIEDVEGLQTWNKGKPATCMTPQQANVLYNSAPLMSNNQDMGQGRTIGISSWDGFDLTNTSLFISQYGIPTPPAGPLSNISVESIGGGSENGQRLAEGDLDPQMVIGQAPLATVIIYDGAGGGDTATDQQVLAVYTQEENENKCDIITESYAWALAQTTAVEAHTLHLEMSGQGITYMAASGDDQNFEEQEYWYPVMEPEVLIVGGTSADVTSQGNRNSEVAWLDGSGGWSLVNYPFNRRPAWQKGNGVPTNVNYRLSPDVAGHASGTYNTTEGAYFFYYYYSLTDGYVGTSFACPIFAGGLAIAEQQLLKLNKIYKNPAGRARLGRIQDLIYSQNGNPSVWYDITSGSNGTLPNGNPSNAGPGWDFCTGWGAVNWNGFVQAYPALSKGNTVTAH